MELTVKDVLKMENIMNKVKDVVSNSVTITDHKSAGSIRLTECTMPEFEGFDICYLSDNKEETGNYIGSFFIENADSDKPKMVYYEDAYEEKGKKEIPLYEANENPTISYENYQLQWMMDHGYSLQDLMRSMDEYYAGKDISNREIEDLFNEWQDEYGFHYELWACDGEAECMDYHSIEKITGEASTSKYLVTRSDGINVATKRFQTYENARAAMTKEYENLRLKQFVRKSRENSYCGAYSARLDTRNKTYQWKISRTNEIPENSKKKEYLLIFSCEFGILCIAHFESISEAREAMHEDYDNFEMEYHSNLSLNEQKRYEELSEIGDNYANLHCRNENGKEDTYNWKIIERENVK